MKPITPSLPFLSFPTERVLAEFRPVRALLVETPAPEGTPAPGLFSKPDDILAMEFHDPRILIAAIAEEMGYDTDKIASGQGETGVEGHFWLTYCDARWLPMLVRWKAGEAQLVVTLVETVDRGFGPSDLRMTILGDEAAKPIMRRLAVALSRFGLTRRGYCHGLAQVDGVSRRVEIPEIAIRRLPAKLEIFSQDSGVLNEVRAAELPDLLLSCDINGVRGDWDPPVPGRAYLEMSLRHAPVMIIPPERAVCPEMVEMIQKLSVPSVRALTTKDLRRKYASKEARNKYSSLVLAASESAECQQQRAYLAGSLLEIDKVPFNEGDALSFPGHAFDTLIFRAGATSIGDDMRWPAAEVFAGAGPQSTPKGMSRGLIELALGCVSSGVQMMWGLKPKELAKPPREGWAPKEMKEYLLAGPGSPRAKIFRAEKPSFGIHQGLPIAVNYTAVVWRKGDEQAMAIDFAYLREADGVHLARVRRCAVPGRDSEGTRA